MFISAAHIDVKLKQDYADFFIDDENHQKGLIICDGIGEFKDSAIVAKTVVELFTEKKILLAENIIHSGDLLDLKETNIVGGTTLISAFVNLKLNKVKIQYLGNGGIIHFRGDFAENANLSIPYRYSDIMIPHIAPDGSLTKHISNHSGKEELKASEIELKLNTEVGDILLFFSDGIGSLENNVVLMDDEKRYWRYENSNIQIILKELVSFLSNSISIDVFEDKLIDFNKNVLEKLKSMDCLEDDASLGIIISNQAFNFFNSRAND